MRLVGTDWDIRLAPLQTNRPETFLCPFPSGRPTAKLPIITAPGVLIMPLGLGMHRGAMRKWSQTSLA